MRLRLRVQHVAELLRVRVGVMVRVGVRVGVRVRVGGRLRLRVSV